MLSAGNSKKSSVPSLDGARKASKNLDISGVLKTEYTREHNLNWLNSDIADQYGYYTLTFDTKFAFEYGTEEYGRSLVRLVADMRHKGIAGFTGAGESTLAAAGKLGSDATSNSHSHPLAKPVMGIRNVYGEYLLNEALGLDTATDHRVKTGYFDFTLGRGIAYDQFYGLSKPFLGVFSDVNSYSPFGIALSGEITKGVWSYDLYWARLDELSAKPAQTLGTDSVRFGDGSQKTNGTGKSNDIFAMRSKYLLSFDKYGTLSTETYALYNKAQDQKVEVARDANVDLYTGGIALEYKNKNFEWGFEGAVNRGQETLKQLDRNSIVTKNAADGSLKAYHSKVMAGEDLAAATSYIADAVSLTRGNDIEIGEGIANASDRMRKSYTNSFVGWMMVTDASYTVDTYNLTVAGTAGYATGDENPHAKEADKDYRGFVGINENYAGKRVSSVLTLNARKTARPLYTSENDTTTLVDNSFSNLIFVGGGMKWACCKNKGEVSLNALGYWNDKASKAYDAVTKTTKDTPAGSFLGTELNTIVKYTIFDNLKVQANGAFFVPGPAYDDIKGLVINGQEMGTSVAFYGNVGMQYSF